MTRPKGLGVTFLGLFVAFGLCTAAAQERVLRVVPHADLRTLDPHLATALITKMHGAMVYETLLSWDSKLNVRPVAAERLDVSADRLTYSFTLRPGLTFHDGSPLRSADAVASLRRWMAKDLPGGRLNQQLSGIDIESDRVFHLRLKQPYSFVEFTLGAVGALLPQIMRERDAQTDPNTQVAEIVGSGPFRFRRDQWVAGAKVIYERNPDYRARTEPGDGLAGARVVNFDRVEWQVIPDPATAASALLAGEVDFWDTVPIDLLSTIERNPDIATGKLVPLPYVGNIRMNQRQPPFDNPKLRAAVAAIVDQTEMMQAAVGDPHWFSTCLSYFVCGSPNGTLTGSEAYAKPDLARAKQLMAEGGYNGERVVLLGTKELAPIGGMSEVLNQRLRAAGFNVDYKVLAWGTMLSIINKYPPEPGGWNIFATYSTGAVMHHPLTNIFADTNCEARSVAGWPCDREGMRLKAAYLAAADPATQRGALDALHQRLWDVVVYIPAGQFDAPFAWRRNLSGVAPMALPVFWNMSKGSGR
jgi:peptide/nickel transport system substrate-binding protein